MDYTIYDHYSTIQVPSSDEFLPLLYSNRPTSSSSRPSPRTVFMITITEATFVGICLEGFFYGKIFVLWLFILTCTLAKKKIIPGLGLYTGIFAMYLQCPPNKTRTATILFYALCVLYVLSIAAIVGDLVTCVLQVSTNSICKNIIFL